MTLFQKTTHKCAFCRDFGEIITSINGKEELRPCPHCQATIPIKEESTQIKKDTDKKFPIQLILIDLANEVHQLGEVMKFGAIKYPKRCGWKEVPLKDWQEAITRHTHAYNTGEYLDQESGLSHLAHIAVDCLVALYHEKESRKSD